MAGATSDELTQAAAELWCHNFGYLKSMALRCAIELGIPTAIHRLSGTASLSELHAALPIAAGKWPFLSHIMTLLAASGIFTEETKQQDGGAAAAEPRYHLTTASRLLVDDDDGGGTSGASRTCISQLLTLSSSPFYFTASQNLAEWLKEEAARSPFAMAHGAGFYDMVHRDAAFGACFDEAMASSTRLVSEIVVRDYGEVFAGVSSVVDVGGHNGTMARAIAKAFPHVRCSVLELPHMVDAMMAADGDSTVEFVAGDMREFIPPADAVLFKV
nr:unnamed protein product [Digitaria exilis]